MSISKAILSAALALGFSSAAMAFDHSEAMKQVATYKPMAAFNHVVGDARFVGYFLPGRERCEVTVFQARADDETLAVAPRRMILQIAAGDRSELAAGPDAALAIACTVDADAIKIAPQSAQPRAARL